MKVISLVIWESFPSLTPRQFDWGRIDQNDGFNKLKRFAIDIKNSLRPMKFPKIAYWLLKTNKPGLSNFPFHNKMRINITQHTHQLGFRILKFALLASTQVLKAVACFQKWQTVGQKSQMGVSIFLLTPFINMQIWLKFWFLHVITNNHFLKTNRPQPGLKEGCSLVSQRC